MSSKKAETRERVKAMREEQARKDRARERMMRFGIAGAVLVAIAIIAVAVINNQGDGGDGEGAIPTAAAGEHDGILIGDPEAPVTIEYWMDFLCPACQSFEQTSGPTLDQFVQSGDVNVIHYPLTFTGGVYSSRANNAFACAAEEGMASEFKKAAFGGDTLPQWTDNQLVDFGQDLGIEGDYESCVHDGTYSDWSTEMTDAARTVQIEGTPSVFVDGEYLEQWQSPQALAGAIESALGGGSGSDEEAGGEDADGSDSQDSDAQNDADAQDGEDSGAGDD